MKTPVMVRLVWFVAVSAVIVLSVLLALRTKRPSLEQSPMPRSDSGRAPLNTVSPTSPQTTNPDIRSTSGPSIRVSQILQQLDSGADGSTGQSFKVGKGGRLESAPTRRVALLEELARLDPKAAAAYAEKILSEFRSPDEWAISLRDYALANSSSESKAFLKQKLLAMWRHEPWHNDPSVGFLEAFDVAVHIGGTDLMPALTDMVRLTNNQAVAHAAFLALDRLTINDPFATLKKLQAEPELMNGREASRGNYFARAEVGEPRQRALVEQYLLDSQLSGSELNIFVGLFPLASFDVHPGLITGVLPPDNATVTSRDLVALGVVDQWLDEPRFSHLRPQLQKVRARLITFVKQAQSR